MQDTQYFDNIFQMNRTTSQEKYDNMEKQLNDFITYIKSQNLSPIEQVMVVYDRAKMFESAGSDTSLEVRQLPDVMANNRAVCAGYTNFFNECMARLGYKNCAIESYIGNVSHMHSLVEINDDKYDIHGIYNFDPTFDSLDINFEDRTMSYAFFGRSVEEINHLREQRTQRGISIALMKGMDGKYNEVSNEIPTRTMNIVNGFFPSEENSRFIQEHYAELKDKSNWPSLNEEHLFQISNLGFKVRRADNIPVDTLEQIISNVRKIENPNLGEEQIKSQMDRIREFNNSQFSKYYNDPRLLFKIIPKNYVSQENYPQVLEQISALYSSKNPDKALKTIIEFTNGQQQQVLLRIDSLSDEEKKTLLDCTFDSNYDFMSRFLNPLIHSYAQSFPYQSSKIGKPEYFNLNIRNYDSNSINGSSLSIIDGNLDYLQQIDSYIKSNSQKAESPVQKEDEVQMASKTNDNFFAPPSTSSVGSIMDSVSEETQQKKPLDDDISKLMNDSQDPIVQSQGTDISEMMDEAIKEHSEEIANPSQSSVESIMDNSSEEELPVQTNDDVSTLMSETPSHSDSEIQSQDDDITNLMDEAAKDKDKARINQYNTYRAQVLPLLLSSDPDVCIHSDFTIGGENGEICWHTLEKVSNETRQIISQRDFECDEAFRTGLLEPSLLDYAKTNPIVDGKVNDSNNGLSQYMAFSETNNVLTVNNVSREYANYIDQKIKKVDPLVFQQQMEQYLQQTQGTGCYQRTLSKNSGFLNVLMLSSIVGFAAGFIAFITYLFIKMKGIG